MIAAQPTSAGDISVLMLLPLKTALEKLGYSTDSFLRHAGLSEALFDDPFARIDIDTSYRAWGFAETLTGDPLVGLRVAEAYSAGELGTWEYVLRNAASLRDLILKAQEFVRLVDERAVIELREENELATIRISRDGPAAPAAGIECTFACFAIATAAHINAHPAAVHFSHAQRGDDTEYRRILGCPVRFECTDDKFVVPRAMLDRPSQLADPKLGRILEEHAREMLEALPPLNGDVREVQELIGSLLREGEPNLNTIAKSLYVSPRTLRRRLANAGTSYREQLENVRQQLAHTYLAEQALPLKQVAELLGFSDQASFTRAFKRWTGRTPAQARAN